jgi:branched-chain amino acid transport system permease protein
MQPVANGLIVGATIAVLALAFQLVYLPTRVFHVAIAGVYTIVPLVAWQCFQHGWPWYVAIMAGALVGVAFSVAIDLVNHAPLARRRAGYVAHLISSLGIYIITVQVIVLIWGNEPKALWELHGIVRLGGVILSMPQAIGGGVCAVALAVFFVWLQYTSVGLTFRALADNPKEVALRAYNVNALRLMAFGISGLLVAVTALLDAQAYGFQPYSGLDAFIVAVTAAIIGGRTSLLGPMIAGFIIGLLRAEIVWTISAQWQDAITFVLLMVFLVFRPQGIVARRGRIEAVA